MPNSTHVNIILDAKSNQTLKKSAQRNNRSKRKEAQVRLIDHLSRFDEMGMGLKGQQENKSEN
ncbi:TraY domain-containing protein [Shewanella benthica]|nr:TraY domain-containing protein [Shewanella benthica]